MSKYVFHSGHSPQVKKVKHVKFHEKSEFIYLDHLIEIEDQFLFRYNDFSGFPTFLKSNNVIYPSYCDTKLLSEVFTSFNSMQALLACPCTSVKEIALLSQ